MMQVSRLSAALFVAASLSAAPSSLAQGPTPEPGPTAPVAAPSAAPLSPPAAPPAPVAAAPTEGAVSAAPARLLPLDQALRIAIERHPRLGQARAASRAAEARVDQAFSGFLPSVNGIARYTRTEAQGLPASAAHNSYLAQLSARQLIYDFGQTGGRYRAATSNVEVQQQGELRTRQEVTLAVKSAYLQAHAQKALIEVSRETLANQERHLVQVEGFVEVGTRPRIDLVQAQADVENARLSFVNAENGYAIARVQLAQAMGLEVQTDFDVSDQGLGPVAEEEAPAADLFRAAIASRPELRAQAALTRSQEQVIRSIKGAYGPTISVNAALSESGPSPDSLAWGLTAGAALEWNLFQGGLTRAQVAEARANLDSTAFQTASLRQQVFVEVEQARLGVRGAKQALATAEKLVTNSRERLTLAEGRYQVGAGSIIELADAQLALTSALAQRVQADYSLSLARAALVKALGRE